MAALLIVDDRAINRQRLTIDGVTVSVAGRIRARTFMSEPERLPLTLAARTVCGYDENLILLRTVVA